MLGVRVGPENGGEGIGGGLIADVLTPRVGTVFVVFCTVQGFLLALNKK